MCETVHFPEIATLALVVKYIAIFVFFLVAFIYLYTRVLGQKLANSVGSALLGIKVMNQKRNGTINWIVSELVNKIHLNDHPMLLVKPTTHLHHTCNYDMRTAYHPRLR